MEKVLAVAGEIAVTELLAALARDRRVDGGPPPPPVLTALCEQLDGCELVDAGTRVRATADRDPEAVLSATELVIATLMRAEGPRVACARIKQRLGESGIAESTATAALATSPIVQRLARDTYALVGADTTPPPVIDGDTTIGELARLVNLTLEQVVALALGEGPVGR